MKQHLKQLVFLLFIAFAFWVAVAPTPDDTLNHMCRPIYWTGTGLATVGDFFMNEMGMDISRIFTDAYGNCIAGPEDTYM